MLSIPSLGITYRYEFCVSKVSGHLSIPSLGITEPDWLKRLLEILNTFQFPLSGSLTGLHLIWIGLRNVLSIPSLGITGGNSGWHP